MNIDKILQDHIDYLNSNGEKGARANLYGADLRNANLSWVGDRPAWVKEGCAE